MKIDSTHPLAARATTAAKGPVIDWAKALEAEGRSIERSEARQPTREVAMTREVTMGQAALFTPLDALFTPLEALPSVVGSRLASVRFRIPYPPSANNLYGLRCLKIRGKWTAVPYKTKEHEDFMGAVGNALRVASLRDRSLDVLPLSGLLVLTLKLYRPRRIGDWDNPLKALNDSLNGVAWTDDSQVCEGHVYRLDDKHDPRVEVQIDQVTP